MAPAVTQQAEIVPAGPFALPVAAASPVKPDTKGRWPRRCPLDPLFIFSRQSRVFWFTAVALKCVSLWCRNPLLSEGDTVHSSGRKPNAV